MTLGEKRREFSLMISQFVQWINEQGYTCQYEEIKRSQAEANANAASGAGIVHSLHLIGLAADLSIFSDGNLMESVEQLQPFGTKWKAMHPENCWGGDFTTRPDADHFSRTHEGVR